MAVYATYTFDRLREALSQANVFLVAEVDGRCGRPADPHGSGMVGRGGDYRSRGRYRLPAAGCGPGTRRGGDRLGSRARASCAVGGAAGGQPRGDLVLCLA